MAKKNFYAVKAGKNIGIFTTWDECSQSVIGYKGARFKGFETLEEAKEFMGDVVEEKKDTNKLKVSKKQDSSLPVKIGYDVKPIRSKAKVKSSKVYVAPDFVRNNYEFIAFVDGSYDKASKTFGSGVVALKEDEKSYDTYFKAGIDKWDQWNIVGELEAAKLALEKAIELGAKNIAIYHDLKNIALWATGEWQAKNQYTQEYVRFVEDMSEKLNIYFVKVKGHSTESVFNDLADEAAKKAILDYVK